MEVYYLLIDGAIGFGLLILAVVSLLRGGYKSSINRLFAAFSLLTALWIISSYMGGNINLPKDVALISNYTAFAAGLGVATLLMQFIVKLATVHKLEVIMKCLLIPLWTLCLVCFTPFIVGDITKQGATYAIIPGPLILAYVIGVLFVVSVIIYGIAFGLRNNKGPKRRQLLSISIGLAISLPAVILLDFIIPLTTGLFSIAESGIAPAIFLVICLYYGVVKYSLFDIRLAAVRTAAYALSLITLSVVYYCVAYIISAILFNGDFSSSLSISPINITLALILAFVFQPVIRFFNKITNKYFYKDNYDTDDFFARLNRTLTFTTDLRGLLERAAVEIGHTLKSEQAFFFIKSSDDHYVSAGTLYHKQLPKSDAVQLELAKNIYQGVIVASLLDIKDPIRRLMLSHRIEIILPLTKNNEIIGYLCLGDHLTSGYTNRDMKVLNTMADGLTIAIQNALAVQEIREFNETLKQRIANATKELRTSNLMLRRLDKAKDEFVSMASHQLRTPLTSVKGYISMVLDGDAGKVSNSQKQLLDEAFNSSERMVRLINDFLNVSRIQTGKFIIDKHPFDLSQLIEQEIDSLQSSAIAHDMKFIYNPPKDFPLINIDESKIRQVVMNFADNAIYYSNDNSNIDIDLSIVGKEVIFTVRDFGIGVPPEEQKELFAKFFRASNAKKQRPDGTGVGLYLAKKIITAHNGKVIFKSVQDKGSTFGFSMPIDQD